MALMTPESASIQRTVMDGRVSGGALAYAAARQPLARGQGEVGTTYQGEDVVDVAGLDAISEAVRQFRGQEALPIPESVGRAIRSLVREVLDGLPQGAW
ncbi:MAG: hypothetical protein G8237_13345 [Magnetococcales bacterium]|nr:hypothetical protein [Magnetococcales bacterium]NGZ07328.1 hypothetical protein [Magnetococcales bacterium]